MDAALSERWKRCFCLRWNFRFTLKSLLMYVCSHRQHNHCSLEQGEEERAVVCLNSAESARGRCTPDGCGPGAYCILGACAPESRQAASSWVLASAEAVIHFWFVLVKREEQSRRRYHPYLKKHSSWFSLGLWKAIAPHWEAAVTDVFYTGCCK